MNEVEVLWHMTTHNIWNKHRLIYRIAFNLLRWTVMCVCRNVCEMLCKFAAQNASFGYKNSRCLATIIYAV